MKKLSMIFLGLVCGTGLFAQEAIGYQVPPKEILELVDVERAPSVLMDSKKQVLVYAYSPMYKTIEEVSETELKLAGQRINPVTNWVSGARYFTRIEIQLDRTSSPQKVSGLPANAKLVNVTWSPNEQFIAVGNIVAGGVELWIVDVQKLSAKKILNILGLEDYKTSPKNVFVYCCFLSQIYRRNSRPGVDLIKLFLSRITTHPRNKAF